MNIQVSVAADDRYYTVPVTGFSPPTRATRRDPGDPGEVELGRVVGVELEDGTEKTVPFDEFLRDYAAVKGLSLRDAERDIEDKAMEAVLEELADGYGDDRENWED